jgi:hypothetical protein
LNIGQRSNLARRLQEHTLVGLTLWGDLPPE